MRGAVRGTGCPVRRAAPRIALQWESPIPAEMIHACLLHRGVLLRWRVRRRLRLLPLALPTHQLLDPRLEPARAVGEEAEFRYVAHAHPLLQFKADEALGRLQAGYGLFLGLGNVLDRAVDGHVHSRRLASR